MSERKVLNKYYPPDFDPSKIPRMKLAKNRQYTVRLMAPFNMRCVTCGEYIYKGKKFNARKEDVEGEDYLGIRIFRFYIKCTRCLQEISFRTDPKNTDYEIEAGATRNFMALKLAEEQAQKEEDERVADEATNPMKLLENRTKQSKQELELLESLEELKDLNKRQRSVDYDTILSQYSTANVKTEEEAEKEDEEYIKSVFGNKSSRGDENKIVVEEIIETVDLKEGKRPLSDGAVSTSYKIPKTEACQTLTKSVSTSKPDSGNLNNSKDINSNSSSKNLFSSWGQLTGESRKQKYSSLVKTKSSVQTNVPVDKVSTEIKENQTAKVSNTGALSMLGAYSDSDSSD